MLETFPIRHPEYRGDNAPLGSYPELVTAMLMDLARAGTYAEAQAVTQPLDDIAKRCLWNATPRPLQQRLQQMKADAVEPRRVYRIRKGSSDDWSVTDGPGTSFWFTTSAKHPRSYAFDIRELGCTAEYEGDLGRFWLAQSNFLQQAIAHDVSLLKWPPLEGCHQSIEFIGVA